ncbi:MAG: hypothetical protein FK731_01855 [Asgard group archaeon]|nr:hypothetical protein [Asgard group archaeon]
MAGFIVLLFFGGFSLFGYFAGSMFIFYFILGFAVVCFLIMLVLFIFFRANEKKRKSKELISDSEARAKFSQLSQTGLYKPVFSSQNEGMNSYEKTEAEPIVIYNIQPITKAPPGSKCMISKLDIKPEDETVQCLNCNSYFIKGYIIEWLKNHENCPVCQAILRMS